MAAAVQFAHLFTPLRIGSFTVRNRILSTAHLTSYAENGLPTDRHLRYWAAKAKGGIGLIVTEGSPVHPSSPNVLHFIDLWRDECVEPFRRIADAVHAHGARLVAQLNHQGGFAYSGGWAPSVTRNGSGELSHAMTAAEIREVIRSFAAAAQRMQAAGLDGVEIHGAHGYLIEQFTSPLWNLRDDEYGGDDERRLRFAREVIGAVRQAVGKQFTVGLRIAGDHFQDGGLTQEDMQRVAGSLAALNELDYLSVTFNVALGYMTSPTLPMYVPAGQFVYLAAGVRQVTDLAVFCVGRISDPVMAEEILARGHADMVGMPRANIADPELANKARTGRLDEIRHCIGVNEGCIGRAVLGLPITCALNPTVGHEAETDISPAPITKRVMVVGGGIAGMEVARLAALRGHRVTLYEQQAELGGQLLIAAKAPGRAEMLEPIRYYKRQFQLLGVEVRLGTAVDEGLVRHAAPDAVVVATGGLPAAPPIEGLVNGTAPGVHVVLARHVLAGSATVDGDHVIVFTPDQGIEGLSTADFLAERGKQVEVMVPYPTVGGAMDMMTQAMLIDRLLQRRVRISVMTGIGAIRDGTIFAFHPPHGAEWPVAAVDALVLAGGTRSDDALWRRLQGQVKELHTVGDCLAPARLVAATQSALRVGLEL